MNIRVQRNILSYLPYPLFILLFIKNLINVDLEHIVVIDLLSAIGLLFIGTVFMRILLHPYPIRINETEIHIIYDFFFSKTIKVKDVVSFKISENPFAKSYFRLKNGDKVKFVAFDLKEKGIKAIEEKFNNINKLRE